jgi:hypothetical protein
VHERIQSISHLDGTTGACGADGYGTVFEVTKKGTETVLYSFTGPSCTHVPSYRRDSYYPTPEKSSLLTRR